MSARRKFFDREAAGRQERVRRVQTPPRKTFTPPPRDQEPVEAEWEEVTDSSADGPDFGSSSASRSRANVWQTMNDKASAFFGRFKERGEGRFDQAAKDRAQIRDSAKKKNLNPKDELLTLRAKSRQASSGYLTALRGGDFFGRGRSMQRNAERMGTMQTMYVSHMVNACLQPLQNGVNPRSVMQSVGMMTVMMTLAPAFRSHIGAIRSDVVDAVSHHIENMAPQSFTDRKSKRQDKKVARQAGAESGNAKPAEVWRHRFQRVREGRTTTLLTPELVALTDMGLLENAYMAQRRMGMSPEQVAKVTQEYEQMRENLYADAFNEGIDLQEIENQRNVMIAQRLEDEPVLGSMYSGLAHGRVHSVGSETVTLRQSDGTTKERAVYTGRFTTHTGQPLPDGSTFTLRAPMSADEHQVVMADTMASAVRHDLDSGDPAATKASLLGYALALRAYENGVDFSEVNGPMGQRMNDSARMMFTMSQDGLPDAERARVLGNAYQDAMTQLSEEYVRNGKDLNAEITAVLGENWREDLTQVSRDPQAFVDAMSQPEEAPETHRYAEPEPTSQPNVEEEADYEYA